MTSKSRNANFSQEEDFLFPELRKQYPDTENNGYDNVSKKETVIVGKSCAKFQRRKFQ